MKIIRGIHNLKDKHKGCVLSIGNFDGVHIGHQSLILKLCKEKKKKHLPAMIMLFEPQPMEFFLLKNAPSRLMCLREKLYFLSRFDIDIVFCVNFDQRFANYSAKNFIYDLLIDKLGVRSIVVGNDFHFGFKRNGNITLLRQIGDKYSIDIIGIKSIYTKGIKVSSTAIRKALSEEKLELASLLLGRPLTFFGRVVHNNKIGRSIGYPTANIFLKHFILPVQGVYIVEVNIINGSFLPGIANIGIRPTIHGTINFLEVHILDMNINLYNKYICVFLKKKIRNEQFFKSLDKLKKQITQDILVARNFFKKNIISNRT